MTAKLKTQPCPGCLGSGYKPNYIYCSKCKMDVHTGWKRCTQCKGTGIHLEHLLFTVLQLPILPTPELPKEKGS